MADDIEQEVKWRMGIAYDNAVTLDTRVAMIDRKNGKLHTMGGGFRSRGGRPSQNGNWLFKYNNADFKSWNDRYKPFYDYYDQLNDAGKKWDNDMLMLSRDPIEVLTDELRNLRKSRVHNLTFFRQAVLVHALRSFQSLEVMSRADRTWCYNNLIPFSNSRAINSEGVPDNVILHTDNHMFPYRGKGSLHNKTLTKFEDKKDQAVWRGKDTGETLIGYNSEHLLNNKIFRYPLYDRYKNSELVDIKISSRGGCFMHGDLKKQVLEPKGLSREEQCEYKCIINIEGNDTSSANQWIFSSNSVVLMQEVHTWESPWHYHLKPWVHYVPFNPDNLEECVQWCIDNPKKSKEIIENSNNLHRLVTDYNREYKIMYRICQKLCENNSL